MTSPRYGAPEDARKIAEALGNDLSKWAHQCHAASIAIVKSGALPEGSRVARGSCRGVGGQHSWVVVPSDDWRPEHGPIVYDDRSLIIDPTLWSYVEDVKGFYVETAGYSAFDHRAKGAGSIWDWGCPEIANVGADEIIKLDVGLTAKSREFLRTIQRANGVEGLDRSGWMNLLRAPMEGWPSSEIIAAMDSTPALTALVPIDLLGMLTDRNPGGLYLPGEENR